MNLKLVSFETTDKIQLPGLLYEPHTKTPEVALYLHGNGSSSIFYKDDSMNLLGAALVRIGISFFPFNNRGAHWIKKLVKKREEEEDRVLYGMTFELIKECVYDIDGALNYLKKLGYKKFYLIGLSTGANKIVVYHYYKRKNLINKYILVSGGDDTGLYYQDFGRVKFTSLLKTSRDKIKKGKGRELIPQDIVADPLISYQSLYDTINPNGDYNIFPFNEYMNNLKLSRKKLFREYKTINKPSLVIYGEQDEYCYGNVLRCVEILKKECTHPELFTFKMIKGADHGFSGKEKKLTELISAWLKK
ncbi:hypothetical protein A2866_05900 [Candidatus Roizmanbacteria bacterium RIFCSPHIGHO2_01_FULL_39_8]|uniref:Peptidase S9 prolyl oligopeptidase catalytic domain-containing protein n=3 Tax=Candidatus Roizmaniibacteriota TaxID=1752723 RepID=A0A1F7GFK7_9BACT|nr:MAG: hypothetical protein A2866_05900 [Candidatus Roizmanbacteria bacterium RIFCSPHIGHO2_01_FULL_39_8]OGK26696.1 MAG: hypothetical protein A3C28_00325 [Candidatus Roizmanbacteria bacterium RIFCSPHIGHO2_02_FULL_39_9]